MTHDRPERWLVATTEYAGLTEYTGGIGRHYASLLPALARLGITVDLIVFSDAPPVPDCDLEGVNLLDFHVTRAIPREILLAARARRVRRQYRRAHYDRVFLPEWAALGALLPADAPVLTNLATSMALANEVAGLEPSAFPLRSRIGVALQTAMESRQIRRSAGLIAISTAMLERTKRSFTELPPARVVRNCVEVDRIAGASRSADLPDGWPMGDDPIVLFLGRLERRKGVVDAVRAFAEVLTDFPHARLVMAGASGDHRFEPDVTELLSYLTPTTRDRVSWLGHVAGDALYRAVYEAAVTMCPSRWEGFGNAALEVKAIGSPLVCTTGSGFDDFCEDGVDCLMVPPHDGAALAQAIRRVLARPSLGAELGRVAASRVAHFDPDAVATDLTVAADELLGAVLH